MRGITISLVFVLLLNGLFFWSQLAVNDINPNGPQFFNYNGSDIQQYDQGGYSLPTDPTTALPTTVASISATTGNVFTDPWTTIQGWFLSVPGVKYLIAIVNTLPNYLKALGLPVEFAYTVGYMWYVFSIFIVIMFIRGIVNG